MDKYQYMVDKRGPDLVRVGSDHVFRRYSPGDPKEWTESKFLDALAWGGGDWVWYDDITEEEAMQYMEQIRKSYEAAVAKKG